MPNSNLLNEEELINRIKSNDQSAFEKLFRIYFPRLKRYAQTILENTNEAEDLIQDVFVQVWNKRDELISEKHFASFLYTMVKNKCLNLLKRKVVEEKFVVTQLNSATEELYHLSFQSDEDFSSMEEKLNDELEKILTKMPERCQQAFRLKWIDGKKNHEIAKSMNISTTMVDKHLSKGLQIAKQNLSPGMFLFLFITKG